jgi:peptide chain release factor
MPEFAVSAEKQKALRERMAQLGVREEDLEERFVRSSGAGGQHVNKTSTCVWLKHKPTGIEVKCMQDRSQSVNRFLARRELVEQLAARAGEPTRADRERDRIRRQKARKKRRTTTKYGPPDGEEST